MSPRFVRTAGRDAEELDSVFAPSATGFTEVGRDRRSRSKDLLRQSNIPSSNQTDDLIQAINNFNREFQRYKVRSSGSFRFGGHAPSGAEDVTTPPPQVTPTRPRVGASCAPFPGMTIETKRPGAQPVNRNPVTVTVTVTATTTATVTAFATATATVAQPT
jgi:hypothetical protein